MTTPPSPTPMMAQWHACKAEAKDALLFFRLGDFYEAFHEDAEVISKALHLTLTARSAVPMCGVPFHTADSYIDKLLAKGFKIAIAEQMEDSKAVKGLVKREIVRRITPGTLIESSLLQDKYNNYFACIAKVGASFGISVLDVSTGEFSALEVDTEPAVLDELYRLKPAECLVSVNLKNEHPTLLREMSYAFPFLLNEKELSSPQIAKEALLFHFSEDKLPLKGDVAALTAAGSLLLYLKEELFLSLDGICQLKPLGSLGAMSLDRSTLRHLELTESLSERSAKHTLLHLLDETQTPMGARLLAKWVKSPLLNQVEIEKRQDAIEEFMTFHREVAEIMSAVRDLERLITKISTRYATPRDVLSLGLSLAQLPKLKTLLEPCLAPLIREQLGNLFDAKPLATFILTSLTENPPLRIGEGETFRDAHHPDLKQLRQLSQDSASWMTNYQTKLREETGIKTLKVGYTRAFGYYIEVSRAQGIHIPPLFSRRQTLTNAERFITEELKTFEHQVLSAEERMKALEIELFEHLRQTILAEASFILKSAAALAHLDVLYGLAKVAKKHKFVRPKVDTSDKLEIIEGRHPILNALIGSASFIPNDTLLSTSTQMMLITGPNMAGKSTYIRQVALIVILAQMGSFVPAKSAHIGLIDKVFSRIGASDDLSRGQSTFMVEMSETAHILQAATSRSLVILDEIGRGTSTYDGIAIAWAVAEYLLTQPRKMAKTLFATHYWELTRLSDFFPHAKNFHSAIQEVDSGIVFLRKIVEGGTDKSYGIHVARLAGLPAKVLQRAEKRLAELECEKPKKRASEEQLTFFP